MPTLPSFPHVLAQLQPVIPSVYSALEAALQKTREFFDVDTVEVDRSLAPNLVRYYAKRFLSEEGWSIEYEQPDYELQPLPNNGLCLKYGRHEIRILKADDGELPAPGQSKSRQRFWNWNGQQSFDFSYDHESCESDQEELQNLHLIILWDVNSHTYQLNRLLLGCPVGGDITTASAYFLEEIPHPLEVTGANTLADTAVVIEDLDISLVEEQADGQP